MTLAASAAALLALVAVPALAQPPGGASGQPGIFPPPPPVQVNPTYYQPPPDPSVALLQPGSDKEPIPPSKAFKIQIPEAPGGASLTKLPPRESIFMVYDDTQLERAIMERLIQDRIAQQVKQLQDARDVLKLKTDPKEIALQELVVAGLEKTLQELRALKNPTDDPSYRFPALPVVSPKDVTYKSKTWAYEPRQVLVEPGYVVHRRLHFEERNGERSGWDLGPLSTLVGATHFGRDMLMWPQSLASGCVYGFWSTSAGKCLPGSPSPYYLYPPGLTVTGSVFEAGVLTGSAFFLP